MDVAETLSARLIGTVFVERGLLSESQIRVALEIQRETGQQLGQILVERFGVSRQELASVVAEQWAEIGRSGIGLRSGHERVLATARRHLRRAWLRDAGAARAGARAPARDRRAGRRGARRAGIDQQVRARGRARRAGGGPRAGGGRAAAAASQDEPTDATVHSLTPRREEPAAVAEPAPETEPEPRAGSRLDRDEPADRRRAAGVAAVRSAGSPSPRRRPGTGSSSSRVRFPRSARRSTSRTLGERIVLRLGRSPLWQDQRTCVFLEQLVREEHALAS